MTPHLKMLIKVDFDKEKGGLYFATSKNMPGVMVVGLSIEELRTKMPGAVDDLFRACDIVAESSMMVDEMLHIKIHAAAL